MYIYLCVCVSIQIYVHICTSIHTKHTKCKCAQKCDFCNTCSCFSLKKHFGFTFLYVCKFIHILTPYIQTCMYHMYNVHTYIFIK